MRRKWAQWKSAWGKTGWGHAPVTNNHFNYHTNSSITETSRMTISLEQPASPTSDPSENLLSTVKHNVNGQQKNSSTCKNGEVTMLNKMEDTDIWLVAVPNTHIHLHIDAERQTRWCRWAFKIKSGTDFTVCLDSCVHVYMYSISGIKSTYVL